MQNICTQRRQIALFNQPKFRAELVFPPSGFTTSQLDMRRKAEILKYNATRTNTKTNNLTKTQTYAQMVNSKNSYRFSQNFMQSIDPAVPVCPNDISIPTPTSSCDVPGPIMNLVYDPSVPLYNYAFKSNTLGIMNEDVTHPWNIYTSTDISFANNITNTVLFASFTQLVFPGTYTFTLITPVSIFINGTVLSGSLSNVVDISVSSVTASVYYSEALVTTIHAPVSLTSVSLDTSGVIGPFSRVQYVGALTIPDISLQVAPGFIYEIRLSFSMAYNSTSTSPPYMTDLKTGVLCNVSSGNINTYSNCTPITSPPSGNIPSQSFTSINYPYI